LALSFMLAGCAASVPDGTSFPPPPLKPDGTRMTEKEAFSEGLAVMASADAGLWDESTCAKAVMLFDAAQNDPQIATSAALNAAATLERCNEEDRARQRYGQLLAGNPRLSGARVRLALQDLRKSGDADRAISELQRAVLDSDYRDVSALVALARAQLARQGKTADNDGPDDETRAKKNLQRALAVEDSYMPAFEGLATYYVAKARAADKPDRHALELAALVVSQALRKGPRHAPLHNVAGIVAVLESDLTRAARSFEEARRLDPKLFEAHSNLGALNLSTRGFAKAEEAYRKAIALRPDDYDAHVGLALALRGQVDREDPGARLEEAKSEILRAKALAPGRPEAYFNHALLIERFDARGGGKASIAALEQARSLLVEFVTRAEKNPRFAAEVADVKTGRIAEIEAKIDFEKGEQKKPSSD
jgi:tetratricopeptide (TPR) repeat protein